MKVRNLSSINAAYAWVSPLTSLPLQPGTGSSCLTKTVRMPSAKQLPSPFALKQSYSCRENWWWSDHVDSWNDCLSFLKQKKVEGWHSCSDRSHQDLCRCGHWIKFLGLYRSVLIYCSGRRILKRPVSSESKPCWQKMFLLGGAKPTLWHQWPHCLLWQFWDRHVRKI